MDSCFCLKGISSWVYVARILSITGAVLQAEPDSLFFSWVECCDDQKKYGFVDPRYSRSGSRVPCVGP